MPSSRMSSMWSTWTSSISWAAFSSTNDRVAPFFDEREVKLSIVLTDRGTKYCGNPEHHEYEPYLAVEDIDHSRTKTKSPQTNEAIADG